MAAPGVYPVTREALWWANLQAALKGTPQDLTATGLNRSIFLLVVPMVLEMVPPALFILVEGYWASRLGAGSLAVLGLAESMGSLVLAVSLGLGVAATALVARRTGEKNLDQAAAGAGQSILLALVVSLLVGVPSLCAPVHLLQIMGTPASIVSPAAAYVRIYLGAAGLILLLYVNNGILRGAGEAAIAMRLLWISILVNAVADPILMFGLGPIPAMGITGAALGAVIGRGCGVLLQISCFLRGTARFRMFPRHLRVQGPVMVRLIKVSLQAALQLGISQVSLIGVVRVLSLLGINAIAGYTVAFRVVMFALLPTKGASNVPAVLAGQNLGAGDAERAGKAVWLMSFYNTALALIIAVPVFCCAGPIVHMFVAQSETLSIARSGIRILILATVAHAFGLVMLQGFNGAGDTRTPMLISIFSFLVIQLPAAWLFAITAGMKANGAFFSVLLGECTAAIAGAAIFRVGHWKQSLI